MALCHLHGPLFPLWAAVPSTALFLLHSPFSTLRSPVLSMALCCLYGLLYLLTALCLLNSPLPLPLYPLHALCHLHGPLSPLLDIFSHDDVVLLFREKSKQVKRPLLFREIKKRSVKCFAKRFSSKTIQAPSRSTFRPSSTRGATCDFKTIYEQQNPASRCPLFSDLLTLL